MTSRTRGIWGWSGLIGVAVGCGDPGGACAGTCGTAVVSLTGAPDAVVPSLTRTAAGRAIGDLLFLPLAEIGNDLRFIGDEGFEPRLARTWRVEDPQTIVFELDDRATWHDGVPVTARDVVFTFDLFRDPAVNAIARDEISRITAVEARDDRTVVFRFAEPYGEQFYDAVYHMRIHPAHLLDTIPRESFRSHPWTRSPVGNGPYRLTRWDGDGGVELTAVSDFFLEAPGLGRIVLQVVPELSTILAQLTNEESDFTEFLGPPGNVERAEAAPHLNVVGYPSPVYMYVGFNINHHDGSDRPHPILSDRSVREALTKAVDRAAIAQAVMGDFAAVPFGPVSMSNGLWSSGIEAIAQDTADARRTLASAGWDDTDGDGIVDRNGQPLRFDVLVPTSSNVRRQAAVILQSQWRAIGVDAQIEELEFNTWEDRSQRGRFDVSIGAWGQSPSPLGGIRQSWTSGSASNWGRYQNPAFDSLLTTIGRTTDAARSRQLWDEALRLIQSDMPAIWLLAPIQTAAVHARFDNVFVRADNWAATMWRWTVPEDRMLSRDRL